MSRPQPTLERAPSTPPATAGVRHVVVRKTLFGDEAELIHRLELGRSLAVVSDANTHAALGARVERALTGCARVTPVQLGAPHADAHVAAALAEATAKADALVAVGSGTINDLCKIVAHRAGKPYAVFATAPSMNGYVSVNAAITVDGHKKSLAATPPRGVFFDLTVLSRAPVRLIRAGLGDSVCRSTAQADWLLSHLVRGTPYDETPFAWLRPFEPALLEGAAGLVRGDLAAMEQLVHTLIWSGFGMTHAGGSYPASQGEHLISHTIEMLERGNGAWHGEQIGVTTLTMARLQHEILAGEAPVLRPSMIPGEELASLFGDVVGAHCASELAKKRLDPKGANALSERLGRNWTAIREAIAAVQVSPQKLEAALKAAGCATAPSELGWDDDFYLRAVRYARAVRDRYTFLDLAAERAAPEHHP